MDPILGKETEIKDRIKSELFGGHNPDLIVCTSGGIQRTDEGIWVPAYEENSDGGCLRTQAVADLAQIFPDIPIMTSSGYVPYSEEKVADIYSSDLVRKGVDPQRIHQMERDKPCTFTEVISLCEALTRTEMKGVRDVMICTNTFHIPRILAFLDVVVNYEHGNHPCIFDNYAVRGVNYLTPELMKIIAEIKNRGVVFRVFSAEQTIDIVLPGSTYTDYGRNKIEREKAGLDDINRGEYFKPKISV